MVILVIYIFIFLSEPRARPRARPPSLSPFGTAVEMKKKQKRRKECGCRDHPPQRTIPRSGGEENRSSTSMCPSGRRGVLNVLGHLAESESPHLCGVGFDMSSPHFEGCSTHKHPHDRSHDQRED